MNNIQVGSVWKCIDTDDDMINRYCVVKYIDTDPDYNGDGTIELLYANGYRAFGKVRRFVPGRTHVYIKTCNKNPVFPKYAVPKR